MHAVRVRRALAVVCLAWLAVLLAAPGASAHSSLVASDPEDEAVLTDSPRTISLTFDERVSLPEGAVRLFDASGDPVRVDVTARDAVVTATVPERLARGSYVVTWRVISADSHPSSGSITFAVGAPSPDVRAPAGQVGQDPALTRTLALTSALNYLTLFLAGGSILFALWMPLGAELRERVLAVLTGVRWVGAAIAVFTAANLVPLRGADALGLGLHGMGDPAATDLGLVGNEVVVAVLQAAGLAAGLLLPRFRWLATAGVVLAVVSPAWVGHSRSSPPEALVLPADVLHLLAGAVWLGGLVALALTLHALSGHDRDSARVVARFSTVAAVVLAALTATGTVAAWRILGSWSALVHTDYGRLLLVKVGVTAVVAAVAGFNRWRLLPAVLDPDGDAGRRTPRVRTAVWCEAALLVGVLGITGFLTDLSPDEQPPARRTTVSRPSTGSAVVDGNRVRVMLSPGRVGRNTLTVQVVGEDGRPLDGRKPEVSLSSGSVGLGRVRLEPAAFSAYTAEVVLPRAGTWTVQVSLRLTRFDNPVAAIELDVR